MRDILVLCDAGQVRSVAMATVLRERGYLAVAGSYDNVKNCYCEIYKSEENFETMTEQLIKYQKEFLKTDTKSFQSKERGKVRGATLHLTHLSYDLILFLNEGGEHFIGRDEWGDCTHPELLAKCREKATELGL